MIDSAIAFAATAHAGQRRKYRAVPYIVHPLHVMEIVATVTDNENMWTAAVLHDVLEDTPVSVQTIERRFGPDVTQMVVGMTKVEVPGNRAIRKAAERDRLAAEPPEVQTIKVADLIANSYSIIKYDPAFAPLYIGESWELLAVLTEADQRLVSQLEEKLRV